MFLTAPVDLMKTLGMYIGKHTQESDSDVGVAAKDDASIVKGMPELHVLTMCLQHQNQQ